MEEWDNGRMEYAFTRNTKLVTRNSTKKDITIIEED